jgi:hypothetical protein
LFSFWSIFISKHNDKIDRIKSLSLFEIESRSENEYSY